MPRAKKINPKKTCLISLRNKPSPFGRRTSLGLLPKERGKPLKTTRPACLSPGRQVKAVLFDLGNTLYDKRQFMESAFKEVAAFLAKKYNLNRSVTLDLIHRIWKIPTSHYEFLFKELLEILGIYSVRSLEKALQIYHHHQVKLKPYSGINTLLTKLKRKYKIGLLTDGYPWMQRNKILALGWEKMFDAIIYAAEYPVKYHKPNALIYRLAAEKLKVRTEETVYAGDNPYEDFKSARQAGIFTVRTLQGEFKDIRLTKEYEADLTINKTTDLLKIL